MRALRSYLRGAHDPSGASGSVNADSSPRSPILDSYIDGNIAKEVSFREIHLACVNGAARNNQMIHQKCFFSREPYIFSKEMMHNLYRKNLLN